jgi:NitT/TauT family transport system substrate-binding protein
MRWIGAIPTAFVFALMGCATGATAPVFENDLRVSGNPTIELAPIHYAIAQFGATQHGVSRGGIANLYKLASGADIAGHAETQALKNSLTYPSVRIILTAAEGHYRIVAKRSAGVRSVADLRGKKVATPQQSSAHYYLHRVLQTAGMTDRDIEIIGLPLPPKDIALILADGKADAVALWEPEPQLAIERLGDDAIILDPDTGYRELYNLNTTAEKLADPVVRAKIVRFVAKVIEASTKMDAETPGLIALVAQGTGYSEGAIRASWAHHTFPATLAPDLLDTMMAEEAWLAEHAGRTARTREELAILIDPSIEAEARALLKARK